MTPVNARVCLLVTLPIPLLAGCGLILRWTTRAFSLTCGLEDGSEKTIRVDPRLQQVQELYPGTGEVRDTITTNEPPEELGGGIMDESTISISEQTIHWSQRMYRPQFVTDRHTIDLQTLGYRGELAVGSDYGAEVDAQSLTGTCRQLEAIP